MLNSAAWLGRVAQAAGAPSDGSGGVVDIGDPTAVAWASLAAIPVVWFLLGILKGIPFVRNHPAPSALIIAEIGAFAFGANVLTEWRTLVAQGIAVAMGALGAQATALRMNNRP